MASLYKRADLYDLPTGEAFFKGHREIHWPGVFKDCSIHTILDCSIGTGNVTLPLAELGYQVSGSDLSAEMLEACARKAREKGLKVLLRQCDFTRLTDAFSRPFDCVMSTGNSLPHVSNEGVKTALTKMDALVKEGGYLYLDIRNFDKMLKERRRFWPYPPLFKDDYRVNMMQVWDYNPDDTMQFHLLYLFEKNKVYERTEIFDGKWYPIRRQFLLNTLGELGYQEITIRRYPYLRDVPFEEMDWYCVLAKKPGGKN